MATINSLQNNVQVSVNTNIIDTNFTNINSELTTNTLNIGNVNSLTTTAKVIVNAINEAIASLTSLINGKQNKFNYLINNTPSVLGNVYVNTNNPSGGFDGDIYIQY